MNQPAVRTKPLPRLGFLGAGWIGRNRMQSLFEMGSAELVAVADSNAQAAIEAAKSVGAAQALFDLEALLRLGLDGIVIATPSALHAEQTQRALQHGLAVFCQKPLGRTASEVRATVDCARENNRLLGVDLSYRFTEGAQAIRSLIRTGELGDIYGVELAFHNAYGPDKPWFYDARLSGGGCVIDLGIHLVDLALWMLDFPPTRCVSSHLFSKGRPLPSFDHVEDYAVAQLELGTQTVAQLACSWKLPAGCDAVIEAAFYGTRGGATLRNVNGSFYDFTAERMAGTQRQALSLPPDSWSGKALTSWAHQLSQNPSFATDIEQIVAVSDVLDAIYSTALKDPHSRTRTLR